LNFKKIFDKKTRIILKDVNFSVKRGENFGIIGRNGSGKSTLLRILAGIMEPTRGSVNRDGEILYLSGFGNGFSSKLSLVDNVMIYGTLMGIDQKIIEEKMNDIFDFAELTDRKYDLLGEMSDGMKGRLSFATTYAFLKILNPEILLLDEVSGGGGGDIFFQEKIEGAIDGILKSGMTVITVSHAMSYIAKNCDRVLLLEKGEVVDAHGVDAATHPETLSKIQELVTRITEVFMSNKLELKLGSV
jgi:ABC-type polysaccharide/polyol phosphate transport system ATPase subunit